MEPTYLQKLTLSRDRAPEPTVLKRAEGFYMPTPVLLVRNDPTLTRYTFEVSIKYEGELTAADIARLAGVAPAPLPEISTFSWSSLPDGWVRLVVGLIERATPKSVQGARLADKQMYAGGFRPPAIKPKARSKKAPRHAAVSPLMEKLMRRTR
jgi:hypothetical protein